LKSDNADKKEYQGTKVASRFYTRLKLEEDLSEEQYWALLSDIKQKNKDIIIAPYFKTKHNYEIGLSNFFYVKLKEEKDTIILRQMTIQTKTTIIEQDAFMPLWFVLSTTEASKFNALEHCNFFYESGLFSASEPDLMFENMEHLVDNPHYVHQKAFSTLGEIAETECANDSLFSYQWNLKNTGQQFIVYTFDGDSIAYQITPEIDIKACDAWHISTGNNVKVAVFDSGVDIEHPDLVENMSHLSYNCETGGGGSSIDFHGTACAGIIGGIRNNEKGIAGVAPNCKLISISFSYDPSNQLLSNQKIAMGINWAWQNGADVISNSWYIEGTLHRSYIIDAIDSAVTRGREGKGCIMVFAAGNFEDTIVTFPASLSSEFSSVIAVGAITPYGERKTSSFWDGIGDWGSNYGSKLDIMAPGSLISTTSNYIEIYWPFVYFPIFSGTSAATPHVSGVAALILSVNPNLTGQQVRNIIESTAQKIRTDLYDYEITPNRPNGTWHEEMGYGLVDAHAAVLATLETICYSNLPLVHGTITQNTTWNTDVHATGDIIISSGTILTVNSQVKFENDVKITVHPGGKFVIDGGTLTNACEGEMWKGITILGDHTMPMLPAYQGWLELKNGVTIENAEAGIIIKGGGFTVDDNVTFQNIPGGIVLENALSEPMPWFYDNDIEYNLMNITFNNTPLNHRGTRLNVSNCTFSQGSNVEINLGVSNIDNCTFNETTFTSNSATKTDVWHHTTVSNCFFNGNNSAGAALQVNNSRILEIYNNTIHGYETGIDMNYSGATTAYYYGCKTVSAVHDNNISNCSTGVRLFSSILNIVNNNIHNNFFGVRLFNNSSTSFHGWGEPTVLPQNISDNESYELYASSSSFPIFFRFNEVIDENNLGNSLDDPKVYWDLNSAKALFPSSMVRDVKYNCWGDNFNPLEDFYPHIYYVYDPIWCHGKSGIPAFGTDETLFQTALDYLCCEDYTGAELVFLDLIENYPESQFAVASMYELFALEPLINNDYYKLQNYFASFAPKDSALYEVADFLATRCNVMEKYWQPAVDWYENRIENPPNYQDSVFAVIDLGNIHLMMAADTIGGAKSGRVSYRLAALKPESKEVYEINKTNLLATLPQIKKLQNEAPQNPYSFINKKGSLGQAIPNPATGNATINYEIYTEGAVEIRIYNISGQLLQTLPQGKRSPGYYQTRINLSGMSAGMYYYSLFVNGERADGKKLIVN